MNRPRSHTLPALAFAAALFAGCAAEEPTGAEGAAGGEAPASYQGAVASTDVALGQQVFEEHCSGCHPNGAEGYGPGVAGIGWDPARMRQQIREGADRMPGFGEDKISSDELEALLAYLVTVEGVVSASPAVP